MPVIDSFITTSFNQDGTWSKRDCNVENAQDHNYLTKRTHRENLKLSKEGSKLLLNSTYEIYFVVYYLLTYKVV